MKKIFAVLLIALTCLSLTGCSLFGGGKGPGTYEECKSIVESYFETNDINCIFDSYHSYDNSAEYTSGQIMYLKYLISVNGIATTCELDCYSSADEAQASLDNANERYTYVVVGTWVVSCTDSKVANDVARAIRS